MQFKEKQAIYIQIADLITENILEGRWNPGDRVPSTREMAVLMEVNPNTIVRTYGYLQEQGLIVNKRGLGYFVSPKAPELAAEIRRRHFIEKELPVFFKNIKLLAIDIGTVEQLYRKYCSSNIRNS